MVAATKVQLRKGLPSDVAADALLVPVRAGELSLKPPLDLEQMLTALGRGLLDVVAKERFLAKPGQLLSLYTLGKVRAPKVVFVGLGQDEAGVLQALHAGVGEAARLARTNGALSLAIMLRGLGEVPANVVAAKAVEAALLGTYSFDRYISDEEDRPKRPPLSSVQILTDRVDAQMKRDVQLARAIAEATNKARDLVNEPPGSMTPEDLASAARSIAKEHGLKCTVKGLTEIEKLRMGLFRAVSLGADTEPRLITLEYRPKGRTGSKGIALIGKGITFDSGGYDLKPPQGMDGMKMDMAGAATVIATMQAVAAIKPPFPVTGFVGACENLVSGRAYKPGDVLKSRKGITVEVNNTDAEGRLVLADLLTHASEQGFEALVDVATLTGACVVALGPLTFGAFSNDDRLVTDILDAASVVGEDVWRMPLNRALADQLKSDIADTKNTGERMGGAITASLFLSRFVGDTPWAHLDIAGPAMYSRDRGATPKGASGVGVRTLAQLIKDRAR